MTADAMHPADKELRHDYERIVRMASVMALLPDEVASGPEGWRRLHNLSASARTAREHLANHPKRDDAEVYARRLADLETAAGVELARFTESGTRELAEGEWLLIVGRLQDLALRLLAPLDG